MPTPEPRGIVAAELELFVHHDDAPATRLVVRLLVPVKSSDGEWHCEVQLAGYRNRSRLIYGVDSWQALLLAYRFAEADLHGLMPRLWHLNAPADPRLLFGPPPTA